MFQLPRPTDADDTTDIATYLSQFVSGAKIVRTAFKSGGIWVGDPECVVAKCHLSVTKYGEYVNTVASCPVSRTVCMILLSYCCKPTAMFNHTTLAWFGDGGRAGSRGGLRDGAEDAATWQPRTNGRGSGGVDVRGVRLAAGRGTAGGPPGMPSVCTGSRMARRMRRLLRLAGAAGWQGAALRHSRLPWVGGCSAAGGPAG